MKTRALSLLLVFSFIDVIGWGQTKTSNEWIKNPMVSSFTLNREQELRDDLMKQNQIKILSNIDLQTLAQDVNSQDVERRLSAIKILGQIPLNNQISNIEKLLVSDPSFDVREECAKSLKYLKSTSSIPLLLKQLETSENQLRFEIALTLAALGEKDECLKTLVEVGKTRKRDIVLNTHIGYLDIATPKAIEILKSDLFDVNAYISVDAAIDLSILGQYEMAFPILKNKLLDEDKYIRMAAMRGLAYIGNDNSIELIKSMENDTDVLVKERSELILNTLSKSSSQVTSYNPANASSYAEQWYGSFNPAYANYDPNDCANFGSQCLKAGSMSLNSGPGLDNYGCIPACDNLHLNFTNYQGCSTSSTYSGHKTSGYPTWFTQGDIVLFGANSSAPSDPWQHTAINVVTGTPALDAHSNSRHKQTVSYFYPSTGTGFKTADFYHFNSTVTQTGYASVSQGVTVSSNPVVSGSDFTGTFTLKETNGSSIIFESIVCAITNTNNTFVRDMVIKGPITISANGTYNYSSTLSWRSTDGTGNFRAWARGKVAGGEWFDFSTYGGTNPKDFQVVSGVTTQPCSITSLVPNEESHNPESYSTSPGEEIIVNGQANCTFTVSENCSWLTVSPMAGTTNSVKQALLNYSINANPSSSSRQCTFYVNDSPVTITQNGCNSGFSHATKSVSASGATYNLDIDSYSPCSWNIQNDCPWVQLSQQSSTGNQTITVTVEPNSLCDARTCTLTINPGVETHVISQPSNFVAPSSPSSISASQTIIEKGKSTTLQVVGGSLNSATEWVWYTEGCGVNRIGSGPTIIVTPTVKTTYYVQATACGSSTTCKSITIDLATALDNVSISENIKIIPNPTKGKFDVLDLEVMGGDFEVQIFDNLGKIVFESKVSRVVKNISLDLSALPDGMYIVKLLNKDISIQKKVNKI